MLWAITLANRTDLKYSEIVAKKAIDLFPLNAQTCDSLANCLPLPTPARPTHQYLVHSTFGNAPMRLHIKLAAGRHLRKHRSKDISGRQMETKCNRHDQLVSELSGWLVDCIHDTMIYRSVRYGAAADLQRVVCVHVPF